MYFVIVKWIAKPDKTTEFYHQLLALKNATMDEQGCRNYNINVDDCNLFITRELYFLEQHADLHTQKPYLIQFKKTVAPMIDSLSEHIFEIKISQKNKPLIEPVFDITTDTSIETIQAIPDFFNTVRVIGQINSDHMLAMPKHVLSIIVDDTNQFIPENNDAHIFKPSLFSSTSNSPPPSLHSKFNWYKNTSFDSSSESSSEDSEKPSAKERQPINRNYIFGEIKYNPDEDNNEDDDCISYFSCNWNF